LIFHQSPLPNYQAYYLTLTQLLYPFEPMYPNFAAGAATAGAEMVLPRKTLDKRESTITLEEVKKMKRRRAKRISRTSKRRTPWGGPYIKPLVERVKLDPKQALLAACRTSGVYLQGHTPRCTWDPGSTPYRCHFSVRDRGLGGSGHRQESFELPS
jgi:hypothetical protein